MDRTRLEGAHGYGAFVWHSGGIPMESMKGNLRKSLSHVKKNGER